MVLGIENAVTVHEAHAEGRSHLGNRMLPRFTQNRLDDSGLW